MTEKIKLSEDKKSVLLSSLKDLSRSAAYLHELINNDNLKSDLSEKMPFLLESHFISVANNLDYQSQLTKEFEERYKEIRTANERIRELEKQLGSQKPVTGLKEQLKHLNDTVRDWWSCEGFNHISDANFTSYGQLQMKFNFMLDSSRMFSNTPESDKKSRKEHFENLKSMGFEFADNETDRMYQKHLIDNPTNRKLLLQMLRKRFPSIEVFSFNNRSSNVTDNFLIWDVDACIYDLEDI